MAYITFQSEASAREVSMRVGYISMLSNRYDYIKRRAHGEEFALSLFLNSHQPRPLSVRGQAQQGPGAKRCQRDPIFKKKIEKTRNLDETAQI